MSNENKINKKSWSAEEDSKLLTLIQELGISGSWTLISSRMGNRSGKQCRERYHNHLKPEINKSTFTKEEDDLVNELQRKMGNQWAKISKFFSGRSDNAVKNRWHIINRSKPAADSTLPPQHPQTVRRHPLVPQLTLSGSPSISSVSMIASGVSSNSCDNSLDLLSLYHSHDGHCHEVTMSSRSSRSVPSSARRSARSHGSSSVAERFSVTMEDVISNQTKQFNSSLVHHISGNSSEVEDNEDSWLDDFINNSDGVLSSSEDDWSCEEEDDILSYSNDLTSLLDTNVFAEESIVSPRDDTEHGEEVIDDLLELNSPQPSLPLFDTFSEAALTQREDPEECDYDETEERDCCIFDNDDLLLLFDDTMSISGSCKPSPNVGQVEQRYRAFLTKLTELTPRTTPRSPACPNVKRQRGVQQGSPLWRLTTAPALTTAPMHSPM